VAQGVPIVALDATLHLSVLVYLVIVLGVLLGMWCTLPVKGTATGAIIKQVRFEMLAMALITFWIIMV